MGKTMRFFGSAPYIGRDQDVVLKVRFCDREYQTVVFENVGGADRITVTADITGREGRYNLITDCLDEVRRQFEEMNGKPANPLLVMTWEKALNQVWARALMAPEAVTAVHP